MSADRLTATPPDTAATLALGGHLAYALREAGAGQLVVELRGELGAGKTVFVRGLARALGVPPEQRVVSPTFTIARAYPVQGDDGIRELHHVDAYRLGSAAELDGVGFEEMCGEGRLTCVEWGEHVEEALPVDRVRVTLRVLHPVRLAPGEAPECPRDATLESGGARSQAVLDVLRRRLAAEGLTP